MADDVDSIIKILEIRKTRLIPEKEQIKQYLIDHTPIDFINVDDIDDFHLKERIPYLDEISDSYEEIIINLKNNKDLDLMMTKIRVNSIVEKYYLSYDPNNELPEEVNKFREFIKESKRIL